MRVPYFSLLALFGLYVLATAPSHTDARPPRAEPSASERVLASGATFALDAAKFCAGLAKPAHRPAHGDSGEKQRLEIYLHREVCAGRIPLRQAQAEIAGNWLASYRKYLGRPE
jgi:hypothetical protein